MGHGQHIESKGSCLGISLWIQEAAIVEDYLLLDLNKTDADVILGYKWLSKLGETMIENTKTFYNDTSWITINNKADTSDGTKRGGRLDFMGKTTVAKEDRSNIGMHIKLVQSSVPRSGKFSERGELNMSLT
ncbi:putative aminoacyl-tRNA ligase [Arabidopsis thaliana]|uniref:Aminoacyl-tRNA ligase n=1 Tax=Arabidopsis thaliana TaxID=3702 RepID=F4HTB1_ARATH|nr:putative aminoacyl-tRNA ligase [Arabidopsis thaliana]AEE32984.1 putative aminoacyl-tRNA ligase [Arabidopsis thaliana]|eukprot:NP_683428.4 putative aminoacyl-tRNA ligase [Arabidopsis thaliana]